MKVKSIKGKCHTPGYWQGCSQFNYQWFLHRNGEKKIRLRKFIQRSLGEVGSYVGQDGG